MVRSNNRPWLSGRRKQEAAPNTQPPPQTGPKGPSSHKPKRPSASSPALFQLARVLFGFRVCQEEHTTGSRTSHDESVVGKRPLMLIAPNWLGVSEAAIKRAQTMAGSRYIGFVADMYGDGRISAGPPEAAELANALRADVKERRLRISAAMHRSKQHLLFGQAFSSPNGASSAVHRVALNRCPVRPQRRSVSSSRPARGLLSAACGRSTADRRIALDHWGTNSAAAAHHPVA